MLEACLKSENRGREIERWKGLDEEEEEEERKRVEVCYTRE